MTEKRFSVERFMNPKYYYGLDGNITDGENVYRTKNMPKEDVNEVFLDEKQLGSNSLMDCLNALNDENEQLKKELESFKPIIFESDGKPVTLYKKGDVE